MSEPTAMGALIAAKWGSIIAVLGGLVLGFMAWFGKRQMTRLDEIERNYVSTRTYNETMAALRNDFRQHAERVERQVGETHHRIDRMLERRD